MSGLDLGAFIEGVKSIDDNRLVVWVKFFLLYLLVIPIIAFLEGDFGVNDLVSNPFLLSEVYLSVLISSIILMFLLVILLVFVVIVSKILDFGMHMPSLSEERSFPFLSNYSTAFLRRFIYYGIFYIPVVLLLSRQIPVKNFMDNFALLVTGLSIAFILRVHKDSDNAGLIQGFIIGVIFFGFILIFTGNAIGEYTETGFESVLVLVFAGLDMIFIEILRLPKKLSKLYK